MRNIYFDISALRDNGSSFNGISRVILSTIKNLASMSESFKIFGISFRDEDNDYRIWHISELVKYSNNILADIYIDSITLERPQKGDIIMLWGEQWLFRNSIGATERLKQEIGVSVVSLIHDLVPFYRPELYWDGFAERYIECINKKIGISNILFVYSQNTYKDLYETFPNKKDIIEKKTVILRLGDHNDRKYEAKEPVLPDGITNKNFILYVSTIQARKNHESLVQVWRRMIREDIKKCPHLLLIGRKGWKVDELIDCIENDEEIKQRIHIKEYVTDEELKWLYRSCIFQIYPSLYEGWGLPIAEALYEGTFCLVSKTSSMPEVGRNFVDYIDPLNLVHMYERIQYYLNNSERILEKNEIIKREYKANSWQSFADAVSQHIRLIPSTDAKI